MSENNHSYVHGPFVVDFHERCDRVISIGEPRKVDNSYGDYKFTVELTSGLYIFIVQGRSIKGLIADPRHPKIDSEIDAAYRIVGHKIGRFIGRAVKYGHENATDTVKHHVPKVIDEDDL